MSINTLLPVPNFTGGEWIVPETAETAPVYNPSTGQKIAETPLCGADHVDESVRNAHEAFADWSETPPVERIRVLFRYKLLLEDNFEAIATLITREHGKNIAEARGDIHVKTAHTKL